MEGMSFGRSVPVVFLIMFSLYVSLGIRIPGLFNLGLAGGEVIDVLVGLSPLGVFLGFVASVTSRALTRHSMPWPLLITLVASLGAAWVMHRLVDQLPGQEYKAVGAYFHLALPLIAALGIIAIWAELRPVRRSD